MTAAVAAVLVVAGTCGQESARTPRPYDRPSSSPTSATGLPVQDCDDVVAQDEPITGRLLLDGCRGSDGMIVPIPYYPCRGSGNVVAGFVYRGRGWSGELRLAWEEKPLAQGTYGTWRGGYVFTGDEYLDVAGCVITWPDLIEPSPS